MHTANPTDDLQSLRRFFETGVTRSYAWRKQQLKKLYDLITTNEIAIQTALLKDLGKGPEESYATETGIVLAEIRHTLKHLTRWMRPRRVATNLVNLPAVSRIYQEPLGVVLVIAPWNYPFQLSLLPLAAAIAAGNTVVLKPSELASATAALVETLITENFPSEMIRVIQGDGATVVPALLGSFRFDHIFFTGNVAVGRSIYRLAAETLTPVTLELGGKSPAIVAKDADLSIAARRIIIGKFTNAGQTCIAPDYILVHTDVYDRFLCLLQDTLLKFYGAQPEQSSDYSRIINEKRFDTLVSFLSGGRIVCGGTHDRKNLYIAPTLMTDIEPGAPVMREEIFGPLLPVISYRYPKEALTIIRRNPDPLAFYLFTSQKQQEKYWIDSLHFGGGCVNNTLWHFTNPRLPFGGFGGSGIGTYHGEHSFRRFSHSKPVMRSSTLVDPALKYPPFRGKLKWFKFFLR